MDDETIQDFPPLVLNRELSRSLEAIQRTELAGETARKALGDLLQAALRLEFAVIPTYLSAAFSLGRNNAAIAQLLTRVAIEEMLHFTVVGNTMNAIGIAPDIKGAVPTFPCDIDVVEPALHLELKPFSLDLLTELFLRIETPEEPMIFKSAFAERPKTVGQFYQDIIDILEADTIPGLFHIDPANKNVPVIPGPPNFRPTAYRDDNDREKYPIPATIDFAIADKASAVRHLKWIVDQGEGTSRTDTNPIDISGLPAHYYRFVSILKGRYLVEDPTADNGYSYSGGSLPFDAADVHQSDPNPIAADYAGHGGLFSHMDRFNRMYSKMVEALAVAFASRDPAAAKSAYGAAIDNMRSMPRTASAVKLAAAQAGVRAGVPFEYHPA